MTTVGEGRFHRRGEIERTGVGASRVVGAGATLERTALKVTRKAATPTEIAINNLDKALQKFSEADSSLRSALRRELQGLPSLPYMHPLTLAAAALVLNKPPGYVLTSNDFTGQALKKYIEMISGEAHPDQTCADRVRSNIFRYCRAIISYRESLA